MKYDFFQIAQDKVKEILNKHQLTIDCTDDDTFADFMSRIDKHSFKSAEKQMLYTYNSMLQTIAFSLDDIKFEMHVEPFRR